MSSVTTKHSNLYVSCEYYQQGRQSLLVSCMSLTNINPLNMLAVLKLCFISFLKPRQRPNYLFIYEYMFTILKSCNT